MGLPTVDISTATHYAHRFTRVYTSLPAAPPHYSGSRLRPPCARCALASPRALIYIAPVIIILQGRSTHTTFQRSYCSSSNQSLHRTACASHCPQISIKHIPARWPTFPSLCSPCRRVFRTCTLCSPTTHYTYTVPFGPQGTHQHSSFHCTLFDRSQAYIKFPEEVQRTIQVKQNACILGWKDPFLTLHPRSSFWPWG